MEKKLSSYHLMESSNIGLLNENLNSTWMFYGYASVYICNRL